MGSAHQPSLPSTSSEAGVADHLATVLSPPVTLPSSPSSPTRSLLLPGKPEDEMAGVGADQDQVSSPVQWSQVPRARTTLSGALGTSSLPVTCAKRQAPPSETPAPAPVCMTTRGEQ